MLRTLSIPATAQCRACRQALQPCPPVLPGMPLQALMALPPAEKGKGKAKTGAKRRRDDDEYDPAVSPSFLPPQKGQGEAHRLIFAGFWLCRVSASP